MKAVVLGVSLLAAVALLGCGSTAPAPVTETPPVPESTAVAPDTTAALSDTTTPTPAPEPEVKPLPGEEPKPLVPAVLPKLYDFTATWCPPCKQQKPIVEALEKELEGKVHIEAVDVDENQDLAKKYGIQVIPTLVFVDAAGNEVERLTGLTQRDKLLERFRAHGFID